MNMYMYTNVWVTFCMLTYKEGILTVYSVLKRPTWGFNLSVTRNVRMGKKNIQSQFTDFVFPEEKPHFTSPAISSVTQWM